MAGATIDIFKVNRDEYRTPKHPTLMVIGPATYLALEGKGTPESAAFLQRQETLQEASQIVTQALRNGGQDYRLGLLQCQWWADEAHELNYQEALPQYWHFRLLVRIPEFLDASFVKSTLGQHPDTSWAARLAQISRLQLDEGLVLQMLHIGEVKQIGRSSKRLREFARKNHLNFTAPQHEIYLPDGDGLAGPHARTILRRPVR